jgi:hypothetical protein
LKKGITKIITNLCLLINSVLCLLYSSKDEKLVIYLRASLILLYFLLVVQILFDFVSELLCLKFKFKNFGIDYILELFAALFSIAIASLIFHNDFTERYSEIICNQEIIIHAY